MIVSFANKLAEDLFEDRNSKEEHQQRIREWSAGKTEEENGKEKPQIQTEDGHGKESEKGNAKPKEKEKRRQRWNQTRCS